MNKNFGHAVVHKMNGKFLDASSICLHATTEACCNGVNHLALRFYDLRDVRVVPGVKIVKQFCLIERFVNVVDGLTES